MRNSPEARRAAKLTGIGEIGASAIIAGVCDFKQFKAGHQYGARLGRVPRQNSSGVMMREAAFDTNHVSVKPQAKMKPATATAMATAALPA